MDHPCSPDWSRVSRSAGYRAVYCPDHPRAWSTGYIHEHILVAEVKIGRLLLPGEVVHHVDEDKDNNDPENLEVKTNGAHVAEHNRERGRGVVTMTCDECGESFQRKWNQRPEVKKQKNKFCSRRCSGKFSSRGQKDKASGF